MVSITQFYFLPGKTLGDKTHTVIKCRYSDRGRTFKNYYLDATTRYNHGKWQFELLVNNISDRRRVVYTSIWNLVTSVSELRLRGLRTLLTVRYTFSLFCRHIFSWILADFYLFSIQLFTENRFLQVKILFFLRKF